MATFRKSASKTRAALENSTALPPAVPDILDHAGEQAARMTNPAKAAKSARKAASAPPEATVPGPVEIAEAVASVAHADEPATDTSLDAGTAAEASSIEAPAGTTRWLTEVSAEAPVAATSLEAPFAEIESMVADQVSHASADLLRTTAEHTAQTLAETAAQAQDITSVTTDLVIPSVDGASTVGPESGSAQALGEFNARLADLFRDYLEDSLAFFAAITAVRSVPEALTVNQRHFQRRLDAITAQSRDLTLLAGKVAAQTLMPFTPAAFR